MGFLAKLAQLFGRSDHGDLGVVSTEELRDANPKPVIVEALNASAYAKGHLPGAINIPRAKVQELAPKLIPDLGAAIVTYCKSPTWSASRDAARALVAMGYRNVREYKAGKDGWVAAGLPLET